MTDMESDVKKIKECVLSHVEKHIKFSLDKSTYQFINAFDTQTGKWVSHDAEEILPGALISNPAKQSNWFRLLAGLSVLSGDNEFRDIVKRSFSFLFKNLTDNNGLIYWGGHLAFDLVNRKVAYNAQKKIVHELKIDYPFYEMMWETDPAKTKAFIEAYWNAHIVNWDNLNFNRHGQYNKPLGKIWDNYYKGGDVFFWDEKSLTFVTAGSNLYYAAAMLARFTGMQKPLFWSKALAMRYVETRQEPVGISGYQFSQSSSSWCNGRAARGDRAQYQYGPYIPDGHLVYESTIFRPIPAVQRCQFHLSDVLGNAGEEFLRWSADEVKAWALNAYREDDNSFIPMLTDGYSLENFVIQHDGYFGPKGKIEKPFKADSDFFWLYCMATRCCNDEFLWQIARSIAKGNNLGDIGDANCKGIALNYEFRGSDVKFVYGLLELYIKTRREEFFNFAVRMAMS